MSMVAPTFNLYGEILRCDFPVEANRPNIVQAERTPDGTITLRSGSRWLGQVPWGSTRVVPSEIVTRETPSWAKVLGVIGILFFLLGLLFFLVKEDRRTPAAVIEVTDAHGRVFALQVREDPNKLRYGIAAT